MIISINIDGKEYCDGSSQVEDQIQAIIDDLRGKLKQTEADKLRLDELQESLKDQCIELGAELNIRKFLDDRIKTRKSLPIQHNPGAMQFKCICGETITFAKSSQSYPMLINRTFPGPKDRYGRPTITIGECPKCGHKHWMGVTRVERKA